MSKPSSHPPKTSNTPTPSTQTIPQWKLKSKEKVEERAVNPMTMIPEDVSISGKMPLPPKAKQLKNLFGF
jgi:hypothetical protein